MAKKRWGFLKWIVLLLLVTGGYFFWYQRTGFVVPLWDHAKAAGELEATIDDIFTNHGIGDFAIVSVLHTEKRSYFPLPQSWVETERKIILPKKVDGEILIREINSAAQELGFKELSSASVPQGREVMIGKWGRVFQKITLLDGYVLPPAWNQPVKKVAIVIDDVAGRETDLEKLDEYFAAHIPLTFAVLPKEHVSARAAGKIYEEGHQVLMHQPMEPEDMENNFPGNAALLVDMDSSEMNDMITENIITVPHVVGMNNHMGSRFTSDPKCMNLLMPILKQKDLRWFFFDSYTSPQSLAHIFAAHYQVPFLRNDLFLDGKDDVQAMKNQLKELRKIAEKNGYATGIGHVQRECLAQALKEAAPAFKKEGIELVPLSEIVNDFYKK